MTITHHSGDSLERMLACGLRWAHAFAVEPLGEAQAQAVAEAYRHCAGVRQVEARRAGAWRVWRIGGEAIAWKEGGMPRYVRLWSDTATASERRMFKRGIDDRALAGLAARAAQARDKEPWFPITPYAARFNETARELRMAELRNAFALAGVAFGGLSVTLDPGSDTMPEAQARAARTRQSRHAFLSHTRMWRGCIGRVLRDFRQALPPEVVSCCFAVRDPALGTVAWLLGGGHPTAIRWRCQALRAQPWALGQVLRQMKSLEQDSLALEDAGRQPEAWTQGDDGTLRRKNDDDGLQRLVPGGVVDSGDDAWRAGFWAEGAWTQADERVRLAEALARMAEMEAAIDGGRPWQASLVALVDFLSARVAAGVAREDGGAVFFNRCAGRDENGCSMRVRRQCDAGETSLWVSPRGLGFLTGRRLGNTPLFVDAMQGVSGPVVDFACGLSGPRRPRRRKDWKVLRQVCEAWQATGGAAPVLAPDAFMAGCPVDWQDSWYDGVRQDILDDARRCLCAAGLCDGPARWLTGLGHAEGGVLRQGVELDLQVRRRAVRWLTLMHWHRLTRLYHASLNRAGHIVETHPVLETFGVAAAWPVQFGEQERGSWTLVELRSEAELEQEGAAMAHCVGGGWYVASCARGAARIISVRRASGERVATAEIGWQQRGGEQVPRIVQLSGYRNRAAPAAARRAVLALLREGYPRPVPVGEEALRQLEQRQQAGGMKAAARDALLADILWREARRWRSVREALD